MSYYVEVRCNTCGKLYETDPVYADQAECHACRAADREKYLQREREDTLRYRREWEEDQEFKRKHNED